jgi:hypothetical protein
MREQRTYQQKKEKVRGRNCQKVRFRDLERVKEILRSAEHSRFRCTLDGVVSMRREIRYYECMFCGGFHLTSEVLRERI